MCIASFIRGIKADGVFHYFLDALEVPGLRPKGSLMKEFLPFRVGVCSCSLKDFEISIPSFLGPDSFQGHESTNSASESRRDAGVGSQKNRSSHPQR